MSLVEGASDTEHRPDESPKKKTDKPRGSMSEPYMWKEQIHTLMKGADSESDISDSEHFLTKGAFLLTPSHGLSMEKASTICEKMEFKGCFSLTKTATGILFKFSSVDDYQMVFKKGFHKVTGSRFYRKIAIPCRPQKTFTVYVYDIPDDIPEEDVRHALFKFTSIVEVVRLNFAGSPREGNTGTSTPKPIEKTPPRAIANIDGELVSSMVPKEASSIIRITLANIEEANILLQNGLDFYGATYFPTELATPAQAAKLIKPSRPYSSRVTGGTVSARVRDLLPVFDQQGFAKFAPPASRLVKPPRK
ncbi:jg27664 [Pararge aegeria aegeria]|uniref:Jg27664 protein n=1 Tax=Pararge aegeria aegeria TaxID=348720 RepID=A0A8S4RPI5_9NEOP|nr:jg27664 [Pararge aegeria aegeria]